MRMPLLAAVSAVALLVGAASVEARTPAPAALVEADADSISDDELRRFATAMEAIQPIAAAVQGGAPSAGQQAQMAAAIEASGLALDRFNAISTAVSSDAVTRARVELAASPPSPAGSAAAAVTDAEADQFVAAMAGVRPIAEALNGAAPGAEQQAEMAAAITASGLDLERFNAISAAVSQDDHLRARMAVAEAKRGG